MLQNLLSTPVSGLATSPAGAESRGDGLAKNLDNTLGRFDKSLILNESGSPVVRVNGAAPAPGGELASDSVSMPGQLLGSLRASLQTLLNELYPGKEFPLVGNMLPDSASLDIAGVLGRIAELASELQAKLEAELEAVLGSEVTELDAVGLAGLVQQLDGVFAQLAAGLADSATAAAPAATVAEAMPAGQVLGSPNTRADAISGQAVEPAQASTIALGSGATLEQVRSALAAVRDVLQQALQQVAQRVQPQALSQPMAQAMPQAGAFASAALPAERGSIGSPAGLAVANSVSAPFVRADKLLATATASASGHAAGAAASNAQALTSHTARGASELSAVRTQPAGMSGAMPLPLHTAGDQARSESVLPATLLPAAAALRTTALGATGFELAPTGQTLEPLAAAMQASAGLLQPAVAQSNSTPLASAHTFTTSVGLPVVNGQWGSQIAQRITWLTGQGIKAADIHLNPPELGPMQVRIDSTENAARVTISAHNAMTREALEMQLPRLRDLFAEQGLELVDVDVENRDFAGGDSQSATGENDAGDDESATPENGLTTGASRGLGSADAPSAMAGATIVLSYALVDAYA